MAKAVLSYHERNKMYDTTSKNIEDKFFILIIVNVSNKRSYDREGITVNVFSVGYHRGGGGGIIIRLIKYVIIIGK